MGDGVQTLVSMKEAAQYTNYYEKKNKLSLGSSMAWQFTLFKLFTLFKQITQHSFSPICIIFFHFTCQPEFPLPPFPSPVPHFSPPNPPATPQRR